MVRLILLIKWTVVEVVEPANGTWNLEDTKDRPTYMHYVCPATWGHGCDLSFKLRDKILNFSLQTKQENEKSFVCNNDFFL